MSGAVVWGGSLHQTFRLLPPSANLEIFLNSDGLSQDEVLAQLPYDAARSGSGGTGKPDPKRYRDSRLVYATVGLLYEEPTSGLIRVTDLGMATLRWLHVLTHRNAIVLGRHAAYALSACQLRTPFRSGLGYDSSVEVFPFAFIWRAMLELDDRISSEELNRVMFKVINEGDLAAGIERIRESRSKDDTSLLGEPTIVGKAVNDRIIPWMSLASFGWVLLSDKRESLDGMYWIRPQMKQLVRDAVLIRRRQHAYTDSASYVRHISSCANLPKDVR